MKNYLIIVFIIWKLFQLISKSAKINIFKANIKIAFTRIMVYYVDSYFFIFYYLNYTKKISKY